MGKKIIPEVPNPSREQVLSYLEEWDRQENYVLQEKALDKLFFETCPYNKDINDILVKASCLNDFYSTNIFSIFSVAKHIMNLDIDNRLMDNDYSLVDSISKVNINGRELNFYSFASKYCSHHKPTVFPIYDSYVDKILRHFRKLDHFCDFQNDDLKNYKKFIDILNEFQSFYHLEDFNKKDLDRYLWQLGKRFYPNRY